MVLFTPDVMYKKYNFYLKRWFTCHQICHQDLLLLKVNLSNIKIWPDFLFWPPFLTEECNV